MRKCEEEELVLVEEKEDEVEEEGAVVLDEESHGTPLKVIECSNDHTDDDGSISCYACG